PSENPGGFLSKRCPLKSVCGITRPLGRVSPVSRQVPHVLRTRSPVVLADPRDLHVLSTPPAFVLSQDQTLQENSTSSPNATFGSIQRSHPESVFVNRSLAAAHERRSSNESHHTTSHTRLSNSVAPDVPGKTKCSCAPMKFKGAQRLRTTPNSRVH